MTEERHQMKLLDFIQANEHQASELNKLADLCRRRALACANAAHEATNLKKLNDEIVSVELPKIEERLKQRLGLVGPIILSADLFTDELALHAGELMEWMNRHTNAAEPGPTALPVSASPRAR